MTEFKVPELGENVAGGDVMRVMVTPGDTIARDQPVLELETDKATIEVPSTVAGTVKEVRVKKGDKVQVGAVVFTVDEAAGLPAEARSAKVGGNGASAQRAANETAQRAANETAQRAANETAQRAANETPQKAATADETAAQPAKADAPPAAESKPAAESRPDSKVISMPPRGASDASASAPAAPDANGERGPVAPASPAVRRLAREIGVNVDQVQGTGPGGRISQEDVKEHARRILSSVPSTAGAGGAAAVGARAARALPDFQKWGEIERQPLSNIRRATAEHLSYAWNAIPHVTQFDKADVTALEELRKKFKDQIAKAGGNLTVTAMLVRILATAVKKFPQFNASIDTERGELVFKKYVNVGVAVDTDRGLLVPVIRNADRKNISELSIDINQLAAKARDRKLTLEEMSGGGISISNLGGIGGTYFTPIVNWPEVAILGVSRTMTEPVWSPKRIPGLISEGNASEIKPGIFEPRQMLPLSLSYDHRVIDGADAMRFLRWVAEAIEQPFLLSLIG